MLQTPNLLPYYQTTSPYISPMPGTSLSLTRAFRVSRLHARDVTAGMMSLDGSTTGGALPQASASSLGVLPGVTTNGAPMLAQQKTPRGDRLEVRSQKYCLSLE